MIGGRNETGYLSSVESYNLETNEWVYVSSLPQPLAAHAGAVHNGKIYISGQDRHGGPERSRRRSTTLFDVFFAIAVAETMSVRNIGVEWPRRV